ncbi:MAG: excinuclease ABC subunit UvrA, partial [Candidatus Diapherotrites archaeon]|nr:excinuclease ABC subunit UvrA [Candidatus Diapherotrites archaeon]
MVDKITIKGAKEHNLKNIDVTIPRNKLVVFTGVSGSGKSSLVFDTLFAEAQRQYLDSLSAHARSRMPKFNRPKVDDINGLSPAIVIDQKRLGRNPRSTVGTATEIYTHLRLLYSRIGDPLIGDSTLFSFNTPDGMCAVCKGLGKELLLETDNLLDRGLSLAQGAIRHSSYKIKSRYLNIIRASELFDMDKPLMDFTPDELNQLLYSKATPVVSGTDKGFIQKVTFEGIVTAMKRRNLDKRGSTLSEMDSRYFRLIPCRDCGGTRLNKAASKVKVNGKTLPEITRMELTELKNFTSTIKDPLAEPIIERLDLSLNQLIGMGVAYLSLNQPVKTLSGGESQRVKMAKQLG